MPAKAAKLKSVGGRMVSAKSKTGDPACSAAVSAWVLGRKAGTVAATVYAVLAKCRQKAHQNKQAHLKQVAGKVAAGRGTWQRSEQARALVAERAKRLAEKHVKPPVKATGRGTPERAAKARVLIAEKEFGRRIEEVKAGIPKRTHGLPHIEAYHEQMQALPVDAAKRLAEKHAYGYKAKSKRDALDKIRRRLVDLHESEARTSWADTPEQLDKLHNPRAPILPSPLAPQGARPKSETVDRAKRIAEKHAPKKEAAKPKPPKTPEPKAPTVRLTPKPPGPPKDHVEAARLEVLKAHDAQREANAAHAKANPKATVGDPKIEAERAHLAEVKASIVSHEQELKQAVASGDPKGMAEIHRRTIERLKLTADRLSLLPRKGPIYAEIHAKHPDVIPPGPIAVRLRSYTVGDAKVKALTDLSARHEAAESAREMAKKPLFDKITAAQRKIDNHTMMRDKNKGRDAAHHEAKIAEHEAEKQVHQKEHFRLTMEGHEARVKVRRDALAIVAPAGDVPGLQVTSRPEPGVHPKHPAVVKADEAARFLSEVTAAGDAKAVTFGLKIEPADTRGHYSNDNAGTVHLTMEHSVGIHVHEQGHGLEHTAGIGGVDLRDRAKEFLMHRVGNEPLQKLKDLFPGSSYRDDEMGRADKFKEAFGERGWYVGKDYSNATEITSMALQKFHEDPFHLAKTDPEMAKFLFGVLDGSLR